MLRQNKNHPSKSGRPFALRLDPLYRGDTDYEWRVIFFKKSLEIA